MGPAGPIARMATAAGDPSDQVVVTSRCGVPGSEGSQASAVGPGRGETSAVGPLV